MENLTKDNYIAFLEYCLYTISQHCYSATWLNNVEYRIWEIIQKYNDSREGWEFNFGQCVIGGALVATLEELSKEIDGWIMWDDKKGRSVYVELSKWILLYEEWKLERKYSKNFRYKKD